MEREGKREIECKKAYGEREIFKQNSGNAKEQERDS